MNFPRDEMHTGLAELRASARGKVLTVEDDGYDRARMVWNGTIDRRPLAVVQCMVVDDVAAAIRFARGAGLEVAVRGGAHSMPGFSASNGGVVIDLAAMRNINVDLEGRSAVVGPGCRWGDFDAATNAVGLAATGGLVSTTGVAGLTLGGGIGWLTRKYGLACDNLMGAELVLASGDLVRTNSVEDPDLLWGLRGGGGNFGVVTSFTFALHDVNLVTGGLAIFEMSRFENVMRFYAGYCERLSDDFTTMPLVFTAPDEPFIPAGLRGTLVMAIAGCHCGAPEAAEAELRELRNLQPDADLFELMPYPELQKMYDADLPAGDRYYFKGGFLDAWSDELAEIVRRNMSARPSRRNEFDLHQMGGAVARVTEEASPFPGRGAAFTYNVIAAWTAVAEDEANRRWARGFAADLEGAGGRAGYSNFLSEAAPPAALFTPEVQRRLVDLKSQYDPTNLFHLNQNIRPDQV